MLSTLSKPSAKEEARRTRWARTRLELKKEEEKKKEEEGLEKRDGAILAPVPFLPSCCSLILDTHDASTGIRYLLVTLFASKTE